MPAFVVWYRCLGCSFHAGLGQWEWAAPFSDVASAEAYISCLLAEADKDGAGFSTLILREGEYPLKVKSQRHQ
jgi:hypothetical protein